MSAADPAADGSAIQGSDLLFFWQTFLQTPVLNFESGIWHCGSTALCYTGLSEAYNENYSSGLLQRSPVGERENH
jgi:hypothetical protein